MQTHSYHWLQQLIRFIILNLVRLFYPRIEIQGVENLPTTDAPVIFVLNHPNGLLDPLILMMGLKRPIAFLAKSTLLGNPVGKILCEAFLALPIYRQQDDGLRGGPQGDAAARNNITFDRCRDLLVGGGAMALFPEGTTHSGPQLLPLRTGAARIALHAEAGTDWTLGVQIVPIGLWYEGKTYFRTSVLLVVGQAFNLKKYKNDYPLDERTTVHAVTTQIDTTLDNVVLQAENAELLALVPILAAWVAPQGETLTLAQQRHWTARLLTAYQHLKQSDPARLDVIAQEARHYAASLQTVGLENPWALELPSPQPTQVSGTILYLLVTLPIALLGFTLSYLPYRLIGPIATYAVGPHDTQTSTLKLIIGSLFMLISWIGEAVLIGWWFGSGWGLLLFTLTLPTAYLALSWGETWHKLQRLISRGWLRSQQSELVQTLIDQRHALAQQVFDAMQSLPAD